MQGIGFLHPMKVYKFRHCYLNTRERRVIERGRFLDLTPKAFDVLQLLVEKAGEIASKDEMLDKVWEGSFVEEGNLPVHISKLRRTLNERNSERFIETVQGVGYRFVAPVEIVTPEHWNVQISSLSNSAANQSISDDNLRSIAVLPLHDGSNSAEYQYLADGFTDSMINRLSRYPDLKVLARDTILRFKKKNLNAKQIGEILGVSAVLTGKIKVSEDRILISIELVRVHDGSQIWSTSVSQPFSRLIEVSDEFVSDLTETLRFQYHGTTGHPINGSRTLNSESYRLYLKGKFFLRKRDVLDVWKALEYFEESVSKDPAHVLSYVEMVECHLLLYTSDNILRDEALAKIRPCR